MAVAPVVSSSSIGLLFGADDDDPEAAQDLVDELASAAFLGDFGSVKVQL
jgi:hypothetical protein